MTTRLNNSMIMVHLLRSLLTNLNSMIAIEAKYVELCKYTVAYVGLITSFFYTEAQLSRRSRATHVDPTFTAHIYSYICQSWRYVVWWFRCTLLWARIGRMGAFRMSLPLRQNFAPTNHFGVVSQRADCWAQPLSRQTRPWTRPITFMSMTWVVSYRIPRCRMREATFW